MVTSSVIIASQLDPPPAAPLSPFPATLTSYPQLTENPATLSLLFATLTHCVTPKSFACHSYKELPGVRVPLPAFKPFNLPAFKRFRSILFLFTLFQTLSFPEQRRRGFFMLSIFLSISSDEFPPIIAILFVLILFRTLSPERKCYVLSFQANPNSFCKTPGVGRVTPSWSEGLCGQP
jgi:hypothetical protein